MIAFGHFLAQHIEGGEVFLLSGGLGAGKSTLARGVITTILKAGGFDVDDIPSPTFTLVQSYPWPCDDDDRREVWHIDLWRVDDPDDIIELGFEEALGRHAMLIEWPERLDGVRLDGHFGVGRLLFDAITISIIGAHPESRVVHVTAPDESRWHDIFPLFTDQL